MTMFISVLTTVVALFGLAIFLVYLAKEIDKWLRTIVREETSAVMGEDFPETQDDPKVG